MERSRDEDRELQKTLRVLDLCTGTGCIALLLHQLLFPRFPKLEVLGIDVSPKAIALAKRNKRRNVLRRHLQPEAESQIQFVEANMFDADWLPDGKWDILVSNPPYISPRSFHLDTSRSVRNYEPKIALVPHLVYPSAQQRVLDPQSDLAVGDMFYPRLLEIAQLVGSDIVVMEVADFAQAQRIASKAVLIDDFATCQIWRDWPNQCTAEDENLLIHGREVQVSGEGNVRAVVLQRWKTDRKASLLDAHN